jgi:hypothetical protein
MEEERQKNSEDLAKL